MKKKQLRNTLAITSAISVLVWVLEKHESTHFKEHQLYSQSLSELRQEHALLNQDILKYRYQLSESEENLNKHFIILNNVQSELVNIPEYIPETGKKELKSILNENAKVIQKKEELIEKFTSQNAILQNSVDYIIVLISQINSNESIDTRVVYSKTRKILDDILLYKLTSSKEIRKEIKLQIKELSKSDLKNLPLVELALFHTEIILDSKPEVDKITRQLLEPPTQRIAQQLETTYNSHYQEANKSVIHYQFYASCIILLLVIAIFYLAIRKLTKARADAIEANKIKLEFLANMSHEIRTPMNGVLGMTALLQGTELDSEQKEFVEIIQISAESLLYLINGILNLSKTGGGQTRVETLDFDLRNCVKNVLDLLTPQAQKKGLELIGWIDTKVPAQLHGSPGYIRQILLNLVGNAIKFTDSGKVWVSVRVGIIPPLTEKDEFQLLPIYFSVTDTGIGIATKDQEKLFRSFSQIETSNHHKDDGTGLGLAISKQLVEMMGGKIGVKSELGIGSTFWFSVPFEQPRSISLLPGVGEGKAVSRSEV